MSEIEWRSVVGYEGYYEVSSTGLVRSLDRMVGGVNQTARLRPGRLLSQALHSGRRRDRYLVVLTKDGKPQTRLVHHLVAEAFIGPRPAPSMDCCHNDGNPQNNHVSNLRWDTKSSNVFDSIRHGTHARASSPYCPNGHEYTPESTRIVKGRRKCLICLRAKDRATARRRRARIRAARGTAA